MQPQWTSTCESHYRKVLGEPVATQSYAIAQAQPIRVQRFDGLFGPCVALATIGFAQFSVWSPAGTHQELVTVVDDADEAGVVSSLLAGLAVQLGGSDEQVPLDDSRDGVALLDPAFAARTGKTAAYFIQPSPEPFPSGFYQFHVAGLVGDVFLVMFLSAREHALIQSQGVRAFDNLCNERGLNPFSVTRPSLV